MAEHTNVCGQCGGAAVSRLGHGYSSTLVGYGRCPVDPAKYHDDNCQAASFMCGNGHKFSIFRVRTCGDEDGGPACNWTGRSHCDICSAVHAPWPNVPVIEKKTASNG